jgi:hypothetical protein
MEGRKSKGSRDVSLTVNGFFYSGELTGDENSGWSGELWNSKFISNGPIRIEKGVLKDGALVRGEIGTNFSTYAGVIEDGGRSWEGELRFQNKNFMKGKFRDGILIDGMAEMHYGDGSVQSGEWRDGGFNGQGLRKSLDGDYEDGEFGDGSFSGNGKVRITNPSDGSVYEGGYSSRVRHGYGKLTCENGCSMEGMFRGGRAENVVLERQLPDGVSEFSHIIFDENGNVLLKEKLGGKPAYVDKRINFGALGELKKPPMVVPGGITQTHILNDKRRITYGDDSIYEGRVGVDGRPSGIGKWTGPGEESREEHFRMVGS